MLGGGRMRLRGRAGRRGVGGGGARLPRVRMRLCSLGACAGYRALPGCCRVLARDSVSAPPSSWPQWASSSPGGNQISALGSPA